ncbi:MAG: hypothetical protein ABI207_05040 [Crocinitomicaceae bacterium]
MKKILSINWTKIALINFLIVSFYGLIMRYKIAFPFPYLDQKNLQHAHSHFAFIGWVSLLLMVLMIRVIRKKTTEKNLNQLNFILFIHLLCAYALLISFTLSGYGVTSIVLSSVTIFISFAFAIIYFRAIRDIKDLDCKNWFIAALIFLVISSIGTFYLSYITATRQMTEHGYLASIYWYLHFQYNGWFFFACAGLFVDSLQKTHLKIKSLNSIFWMLAISCIPAYGLSVLWLNLDTWIYIIVCIAAIVQFYAIVKFLIEISRVKFFSTIIHSPLMKFMVIFIGFSLLLKFTLQLGSTVPAIAKFAFGFRPIVIAYLHLVFLAFTSLFLVSYLYLNNLLRFNKTATAGILMLSIGVILNEFVLGLQGIASLTYTPVPYSNETLFGITVLLFVSLIMVNFAKPNKHIEHEEHA